MRKILLLCIAIAGLYSCSTDFDLLETTSETTQVAAKNSSDNVKLLRAWTSDSSSPIEQKFVRRFMVKVKNLAYQKEVMIHHKTYNGNWVDIPLTYMQSIPNDEEIWVGEVTPDTQIYEDEFAIKYIVDGQTYWDNNNADNYSMPLSIGAYLSSEIEVLVDPFYTRFYGRYFSVNTDVKRNYGSPGAVEVVYTTDGWITTETAALSYQRYFRVGYAEYIQSPNQYDVDKWATSIRVNADVTTIEYAIVYKVDGQEYWDNNFGKNYVINKEEF